ncbi:hypothetical protein KKC83_00350 [Patescibacteria group bacterium]|nr:hypothetical protein [Candidatus Falkowbacteria bacterium]MBU3905793.1 hypothetical protein [Patescibacteria group bacterium]MCG2697669.1 hypothetical protein [Candidatus Parcubacteria bacterium]MBU4015412.1 hypothetical protein [Patescibacteria group bacterium]MBU4025988.1 hypothetical protein [Patescibacteria group bacterium]
MFNINFAKQAQKDFNKLPRDIQCFINGKLTFYANQSNPLKWAKPLVNIPPSTHRFHIRKYRAYFYISKNTIFIERIKLRGQAYKRN